MQKNKDIPIWLREASAAIIKHMNDDHSDVIIATLYGQHGIFDAEAEMSELETDGYYVVSRSRRYFLNFDDHCSNAKEYKEALIKHLHEYKNYEVSSAWEITQNKLAFKGNMGALRAASSIAVAQADRILCLITDRHSCWSTHQAHLRFRLGFLPLSICLEGYAGRSE